MKFKKKLEELSTEELAELLEEKKKLYADAEQEMNFTLSQTGVHLPGSTKEKYEGQLARIQQDIDKIEELMAK